MLGFHRKYIRAGFVLITFLLAITAISASPLYAIIINVPNSYPTIQEAVNNAASGDIIRIKGPGPYLECVIIPTSNIKLVGIQSGKKKKRPTIIAYYWGGPAITINAGVTGVQIIGLNIRLSQKQGVLCEGANDWTVIKDCYVVSNFEEGLKLRGENIKVDSCKIFGNRSGAMDMEGNNNAITQNQFVGSDAYGITVTGNNNHVYKNSSLRNEGTGMTFKGNLNEVKSNNVRANTEDGIVFTGSSGNRIEGNVVRSNRGAGIWLPEDSDFNDIVKNKLSSGTDYGILIESGVFNSVDRNEVNSFGNDGIRVEGSTQSIRKNKVQNIYNGKGISLEEGHQSSIADNEVSTCSDTGILYAGNGSTLERNMVLSCIIDVDANAIGVGGDENVISNNVCSEVSSHVIDVHGHSNTISHNSTSLSFGAAGILAVGNKNTVCGNASDGNNTDGIRVTGNKNWVCQNVSTYNGHFGEHGIDMDGNDNTIDGNDCIGNIGDGINVYGDCNEIIYNAVIENGIDGIDVDGDNGDRTPVDKAHGGNIICGNFAQLNAAEGIENNALSGAGGQDCGTECGERCGTKICDNVSQFNGLCDFAVSRRYDGEPVSKIVAPGSLNNFAGDGFSHEFTCGPLVDSF